MKTFLTTLLLILGMSFTLVSCSEHTDLENAQEQVLDVYQSGSVEVTINFYNRLPETSILQVNQEINVLKSEVESITVVALEDNTKVRLNGAINAMNKDDIKVFRF